MRIRRIPSQLAEERGRVVAGMLLPVERWFAPGGDNPVPVVDLFGVGPGLGADALLRPATAPHVRIHVMADLVKQDGAQGGRIGDGAVEPDEATFRLEETDGRELSDERARILPANVVAASDVAFSALLAGVGADVTSGALQSSGEHGLALRANLVGASVGD